VVTQERI